MATTCRGRRRVAVAADDDRAAGQLRAAAHLHRREELVEVHVQDPRSRGHAPSLPSRQSSSAVDGRLHSPMARRARTDTMPTPTAPMAAPSRPASAGQGRAVVRALQVDEAVADQPAAQAADEDRHEGQHPCAGGGQRGGGVVGGLGRGAGCHGATSVREPGDPASARPPDASVHRP